MFYRMQPAGRNGFAAQSKARRGVTDWPMTAAAAAVAAVMAFGAVDANALALGRIKVLSTLGEPLRAEIDIPEITAAEAESLRASPASPATFRAAGLEFDPVVSSVRVAIQRRANGRPFLQLSSSRPVADPFMDLILNVSSSSGQISRDFTMLFDPQGGRGSAPSVIPPATQSVARAAIAPTRAPARSAAPATADGAPGSADGAVAVADAPPSAASSRRARNPASTIDRARSAPTVAQTAEGASRVRVRSGDTASKIANANLPADISLDQMLVAMLRTNPNAFVNGNVNRIKAGAVLEMPNAGQIAEQSAPQARETLNAQSKDFSSYRRKLATAAAPAPAQATDRTDSAKLQAAVQGTDPAIQSSDKLTLSKGSVDRFAPSVDPSAGSTTVPAAAAAENGTNFGTGAGAGGATVAANGSKAAAPITADAPAASSVVAQTGTPDTSAVTNAAGANASSTPANGTADGSSTNGPGTSVGGTLAADAKPATAAEPSLVEQMLEEPVLPAAGVGLLALLVGFGIWRSRRNKRAVEFQGAKAGAETGSESIFSMSGGRSIDTLHGSTGVASIAYSPSQLDAGGEVDPVAEADVYMAYGREEQALEILKEALRTTPARADVRVKLLEVQARRREVKAFEALAKDTRSIVGTDSREWRHICEIGRELDFKNSLYQAPISAAVPLQGGAMSAPLKASEGTASVMPSERIASGFAGLGAAAGVATASAPWQSSRALDLDLDFGAIRPAPATATQPALLSRPVDLDLDLSDFGSLEPTRARHPTESHQTAPAGVADAQVASKKPAFATPNRTQSPLATEAAKYADAPRTSVPDTGVIDFDFSSLRLELDDPVDALHKPATAATAAVIATPLMKPERASEPGHAYAARTATSASVGADDGDSLSTKLALAEAFSAIGDVDGARSLAHEVIGESSGTLKAKAQRFLASID